MVVILNTSPKQEIDCFYKVEDLYWKWVINKCFWKPYRHFLRSYIMNTSSKNFYIFILIQTLMVIFLNSWWNAFMHFSNIFYLVMTFAGHVKLVPYWRNPYNVAVVPYCAWRNPLLTVKYDYYTQLNILYCL